MTRINRIKKTKHFILSTSINPSIILFIRVILSKKYKHLTTKKKCPAAY